MTDFIRKNIFIIIGVLVVAGITTLVLNGIFQKTAPVQPEAIITPPATQLVQHKVIGKSVEGRSIDAYIYGTGATHLMFVGGVHGGYEWNSVLLAYQFMDYLNVNPSFIPANITIAVIPSANPDGVYRVIGKEGRFAITDVPTTVLPDGTGRFNADNVDLNRNFDCKWKSTSVWKTHTVSAGTSAFSEPETRAIRDFVSTFSPAGAVFWHSQANSVFASQCNRGILPGTMNIMNVYANASPYPAVKVFNAYPTTGAADDWLASIGIPAITVELKTHTSIEWAQNLAGIKALLNYYSR